MRLTADQKQEIRQLYASGNVTQSELAVRFGVRQTTISLIIRQPPHQCVDCGVLLVQKIRCEECNKVHLRLRDNQRRAENYEAYIQYEREFRRTEKYKESHRKAARDYERRQAAKKRGIA
jgi:hypothetical protein